MLARLASAPVTPRPYTPVERQKAVEAGRDRILDAARELLQVADAEPFSLDAVARRAGVSRMTVYNQFESKPKLLEALFDSMAANSPIAQLREVFAEKDPRVAFDEFIALFGRFWTVSRHAHGRLKAAALHDADLEVALRSRNERRRHALAELVSRLADHITPAVPRDELVNVLYALLSFDTFDAIAGSERTPNDVVPIVRRMAHAVLGIKPKRVRKRVSARRPRGT